MNKNLEVVVTEVVKKESLVRKYAKSFGKGIVIGTLTVLGTIVVTGAATALFGKGKSDEVDENYFGDDADESVSEFE